MKFYSELVLWRVLEGTLNLDGSPRYSAFYPDLPKTPLGTKEIYAQSTGAVDVAFEACSNSRLDPPPVFETHSKVKG